jgi:hypothetical protein
VVLLARSLRSRGQVFRLSATHGFEVAQARGECADGVVAGGAKEEDAKFIFLAFDLYMKPSEGFAVAFAVGTCIRCGTGECLDPLFRGASGFVSIADTDGSAGTAVEETVVGAEVKVSGVEEEFDGQCA